MHIEIKKEPKKRTKNFAISMGGFFSAEGVSVVYEDMRQNSIVENSEKIPR